MDSVVQPALLSELISALAADLHRANWKVENIDGLLSTRARDALMRDQRIPALSDLRCSREPAALLTRLFMLGSSENSEDVEQACPQTGVRGLEKLGLISVETRSARTVVRALYDLRPHSAEIPIRNDAEKIVIKNHQWWVLSDLGEAITGQALNPDHVLGIGGATLSLLTLTVRTQIECALDLGTGCGIQALYLAAHADRVIATDISSRACAITRFNAMLNEVPLDVREGSLFDPVKGEKFDLIVTNPPFVITPESLREKGLFEYRDGGMERDNLVSQILRAIPDHLVEGGRAQLLANWEIPAAFDPETQWDRRVRAWIEDLPLDAYVVQRDILDPAQYVEMWLRDSGGTLMPREQWEYAYTQWIEDFDKSGVGAIGMGFLALERSEGRKQSFMYEPGGKTPSGTDIQCAFRALHLPDDLSNLHLVMSKDVTENRYFIPGEAQPRAITLKQGGAMAVEVSVGTELAALVGACDGELSVRQIVSAIAALVDADSEKLLYTLDKPLRHLISLGMLSEIDVG